MSKKWYVVQAYSGFEKNVQRILEERIAREEMGDYFGQILVPVEKVVDIRNGRKTISERKSYPGYVLVEMEMTDDSWHLVKSTPVFPVLLEGGLIDLRRLVRERLKLFYSRFRPA